jgi:hypothetical protein
MPPLQSIWSVELGDPRVVVYLSQDPDCRLCLGSEREVLRINFVLYKPPGVVGDDLELLMI